MKLSIGAGDKKYCIGVMELCHIWLTVENDDSSGSIVLLLKMYPSTSLNNALWAHFKSYKILCNILCCNYLL